VSSQPSGTTGETLVEYIRAALARQGHAGYGVEYIPERNAVRLTWPHHERGGQEGVEFPATPEWARRVLKNLGVEDFGF
jgi:hypothetical protein